MVTFRSKRGKRGRRVSYPILHLQKQRALVGWMGQDSILRHIGLCTKCGKPTDKYYNAHDGANEWKNVCLECKQKIEKPRIQKSSVKLKTNRSLAWNKSQMTRDWFSGGERVAFISCKKDYTNEINCDIYPYGMGTEKMGETHALLIEGDAIKTLGWKEVGRRIAEYIKEPLLSNLMDTLPKDMEYCREKCK